MEYIGLDVHKQFSVAYIFDDETGEVQNQRLKNRSSDFESLASASQNSKVVLEAGRSSYIVYDIIEELFDDIQMANPLQVKAIAYSAVKTDKIDAETLMKLLRADIIPQAHIRSKYNRDILDVLRLRMAFVKTRSMFKNRIHALVDRQSEEIREDRPEVKDLFGKIGMMWLEHLKLPGHQTALLRQLLTIIQNLNDLIGQSDQMVKNLFKSDPVAQRLKSIPGIGLFYSVLISAEIEDINRFDSAEKLCAYAGLAPTTHSSGGKTRHGKLIKCCNRYLKWALIEAVIPAVRSNHQLKNRYERLAENKNKNVAKSAIARQLMTFVYRVWKENREFTLEKPGKVKMQNRNAF